MQLKATTMGNNSYLIDAARRVVEIDFGSGVAERTEDWRVERVARTLWRVLREYECGVYSISEEDNPPAENDLAGSEYFFSPGEVLREMARAVIDEDMPYE